MTHVLIADDDADIRRITQMIVEDADYTVTVAAESHTMLRLLKTAPAPWVVLLDLGLPFLDDGALLRLLLHARTRMQQHAYVLFTAQSLFTYALLLPLIEELAMQRLAKPFAIDDLLATIAQAAVGLPMVVSAPMLAQPH